MLAVPSHTFASLVSTTFGILQNVKRNVRESRICGRKGNRWKMRDSRAPEHGQLVCGMRLLIDRCMREGDFVRKGKRGASAIAPSGFPFAFSAKGGFLFQIEGNAGKSAPKPGLSEEIFPE